MCMSVVQRPLCGSRVITGKLLRAELAPLRPAAPRDGGADPQEAHAARPRPRSAEKPVASEPEPTRGHRALMPETHVSLLFGKHLLVQRTHFPDSFSFWLNKMIKTIIVFVLTSHWPHTKSPPRGRFTALGIPLAQRRPICSTAVTGEAAHRGLTAAGSSTCSCGARGLGCGPPDHLSTLSPLVGIAHPRGPGHGAGPATRLACELSLTPVSLTPGVPWAQFWVTQNILFLVSGCLEKGEIRGC